MFDFLPTGCWNIDSYLGMQREKSLIAIHCQKFDDHPHSQIYLGNMIVTHTEYGDIGFNYSETCL